MGTSELPANWMQLQALKSQEKCTEVHTVGVTSPSHLILLDI